jgi:hypothetical protein
MKKMHKYYFVVPTVAIILLASSAYGAILGNSVNIAWWYPAANTVFSQSTVTVVDPGVEWNTGNGVEIDIKNDTITIQNTSPGWKGSDGFNGFVFTDLTVGHDTFTSFSLVSVEGNPPPTDPILSWNEDSLYANFNASSSANDSTASGTLYTFAFTTVSSSVPEPTTTLLLGFGLAGLAGVRRFRK